MMQDTRHISTYRQSLKERILETAMKAFAQKGIKAVKMDDIATQLSISKRTLYEIYANKEDLLFEGIRKVKLMRHDEMVRLLETSPSVMDIILNIYRKKAEEFRMTSPQFYADICKYPAIVRYLEADKHQNHTDFIRFMERGVDEGYFRDDVNFELIAHMFEALTSYMMSNQLYQHYSFDELFQNLLFITLRGFCTQKGIERLDAFIKKSD